MSENTKLSVFIVIGLVAISGCSAIPIGGQDNVQNPYTDSGQAFVNSNVEKNHVQGLAKKDSWTVISNAVTKYNGSVVNETKVISLYNSSQGYHFMIEKNQKVMRVYYDSKLSNEVVYGPHFEPQFKYDIFGDVTPIVTGLRFISLGNLEQSALEIKNTTSYQGIHVTVYKSTKTVNYYSDNPNLNVEDYSHTYYVSDKGIILKSVKKVSVTNKKVGKTYHQKVVTKITKTNNTKIIKPDWVDTAVKRTNATYVNSSTN